MKFSAIDEYGLRCMLQMARKGYPGTMTIVELAQKEALTPAYVGKLMTILRKGGLVQSIRGQAGGYQLARPAKEISVNEVLEALGGKFYSRDESCSKFPGQHEACVHSVDCSIRSLWTGLERVISGYLSKSKLSDLVIPEPDMEKWLKAQVAGPVPLKEKA
ncbi:MAG TPA: Rrf2 family transcriptional regulator [bacterium]|nr:Rrf2 family transcriptional regulator [bacterium]